MRYLMLLLVSFGLAVIAPSVSAKIYKCTDANGKVYYSQSFDPKTCAGGGAQLNNQGLTVKAMERQKTPQEIATEKAAAERAAEAAKVAEAQAQQDRALSLSYNSEADLLRTRDQEMQVADARIETARLTKKSQEKTLSELLQHAASFELAKQPVPAATTDKLTQVRALIETANRQIAVHEAGKKQLQADYEVKLARYRELKARTEQQHQGN